MFFLSENSLQISCVKRAILIGFPTDKQHVYVFWTTEMNNGFDIESSTAIKNMENTTEIVE